jgi:AraC-like DNA-binding protein
MRVEFSTDGLPAETRVAAWRDYHAERICSITPVDFAPDPLFRAEASGYVCGSFALLDVQAGLVRVRRTTADVGRDQKEAVFVHRFRRPMLWKAAVIGAPLALEHDTGDFCVSSSEWTFDAEAPDGAWYEVLVIPLVAMSPHLTGGRIRRPFRLPAASPLGALLGAAFDAANAQAPFLPDRLGEAVLRNLSGLVAVACRESEDEAKDGRDATRTAQLAEVKRHIEADLANPDLSPESVADATGLSVRQLYRLFEQTENTFARYVLRQRLIRCRDAIAGATGSGRSVVDIAFGWGFNSMATFYRAFTKEFGSAPGTLRNPSPDSERSPATNEGSQTR